MKSIIINQIKNLKIQGATNVAVKSLDVIQKYADENKNKKPLVFSIGLNKLKDALINLRSTEPMQYNCLNYLIKNINNTKDTNLMVKEIKKRIIDLKNHIQLSKNKIELYGTNLIKNNQVIYTHCHSSTVTNLLLKVKNNNINFRVNNTETRPLFQGRTTAKELVLNKIKVNHYVDSEIPIAISSSDIILIGCDSIIPGYFYNKVGTKIVLEFAKKYDKPIYIVTEALKFDPRSLEGNETAIEIRDQKEIWDYKNKYLNIIDNAFDKVEFDNITIISELGVYDYSGFISQLQKSYPWIFD